MIASAFVSEVDPVPLADEAMMLSKMTAAIVEEMNRCNADLIGHFDLCNQYITMIFNQSGIMFHSISRGAGHELILEFIERGTLGNGDMTPIRHVVVFGLPSAASGTDIPVSAIADQQTTTVEESSSTLSLKIGRMYLSREMSFVLIVGKISETSPNSDLSVLIETGYVYIGSNGSVYNAMGKSHHQCDADLYSELSSQDITNTVE